MVNKMADIKTALRDFNPWWEGGFDIEFMPRTIYGEIQKYINLRQIIAFTGLRRVGKTTLMFKMAEDFIKSGFDPRNIVFFSFDQFMEVEIREVLSQYEKIMERDIRTGKYIIFLDEIQKLKDWENQLKYLYDAFPKIKIIISGSEALFIRKKSKETLAGRIFEFKVETLSFKEFLLFKSAEFEPVGLHEKKLAKLMEEFVRTLGFPELVDKEKDVIKKYLRENIIEKVVYRDIPRMFKVKDASVLESLLNIFLEEPGQIIELSDLAKELKVSRQVLSNYLRYLEDSFILRKLYNFSTNRRKVERKLKKYYPVLVSTELLFKDDNLSKLFEWFIVNQTKAEFFWRDPQKNEVDIVLVGKKIMPVEIKYGKIDASGLLAFMKKFGVNEGYIISYDREDKIKSEGKTIHVIPAFKFLLGIV